MLKNGKIVALFAIILLCGLAISAGAQISSTDTLGALGTDGNGKSNTSWATANMFLEDRDRYLNTTGIAGLKKNLIFVNFFTPAYFGQTTDTNTFFNNGYSTYFEGGAGHFILKDYWIGFGFGYGSKNETEEDEYSYTQGIDDPFNNGAQIGSGFWSRRTVNDLTRSSFNVSAMFGNKTWAVRNVFRGTFNKRVTNQMSVAGTTVSSVLDAVTWGNITAATVNTTDLTSGVSGTAGVQYDNYSSTVNGVTKSVSNTYADGTMYNPTGTPNYGADKWTDTIQFGIQLADVFSSNAVKDLAPWAKVDLFIGYTPGDTYRDFGRTYEEWDSSLVAGHATVKNTVSYDNLQANIPFGFVLNGAINWKFAEIFTLTPELYYKLESRIFSNDGTKGTKVTTSASSYTFDGLAPNGKETSTFQTYKLEAVGESSYIEQTLYPRFKLSANFDAIQFAIRWRPQFKFRSEKADWTGTTTETEVKETGYDYDSYTVTTTSQTGGTDGIRNREVSATTWENQYEIGATLWLKRDKLRLNAGGIFNQTVGTWTTTKIKTDTGSSGTSSKQYKDQVARGDSGETTTFTSGNKGSTQTFESATSISATLGVGATFFFNDYVNFDFAFGNRGNQGDGGSNAGTNLLNAGWLGVLTPGDLGIQVNIRY